MATRRAAPLAAFVLHHYDWSESSLILDLFTREQGRVVVVAKGAKRPYSQLRAVLLPLQRVTVVLTHGPGGEDGAAEIHTLRSAEFGGGAPMPGGAAVIPGLYLNELVMKLLARHDPHPALFDAYARALDELGDGSDDTAVQAALRAFELTLLREIGLLPDLRLETSTQRPLLSGGAYTLRADAGLVAAGRDEPALPGAAWTELQGALDATPVGALAPACREHLAPLRGMLRHVLHYHLGTSRLRTRVVMQGVQRLLE
jgi:DNA repair protein RecO (recombination protein O)